MPVIQKPVTRESLRTFGKEFAEWVGLQQERWGWGRDDVVAALLAGAYHWARKAGYSRVATVQFFLEWSSEMGRAEERDPAAIGNIRTAGELARAVPAFRER